MSVNELRDERVLVDRAKSEPAFFAELYDHYFPRVYNYIRYRTRDALHRTAARRHAPRLHWNWGTVGSRAEPWDAVRLVGQVRQVRRV